MTRQGFYILMTGNFLGVKPARIHGTEWDVALLIRKGTLERKKGEKCVVEDSDGSDRAYVTLQRVLDANECIAPQ